MPSSQEIQRTLNDRNHSAGFNIEELRGQVAVALSSRSQCHGFNHAIDVEKMAQHIYMGMVKEQGTDDFAAVQLAAATISAIALLHDVWDHKFVKDSNAEMIKWSNIMQDVGFTPEEATKIIVEIGLISYSKGGTPRTLAGQIVQDADRLLGTGAIGVLRCATYGAPNGTSFDDAIRHLSDKFLMSNKPFNTVAAEQIAQERNKFLEEFIAQYRVESIFITL